MKDGNLLYTDDGAGRGLMVLVSGKTFELAGAMGGSK
jgi:hypothetical protein